MRNKILSSYIFLFITFLVGLSFRVEAQTSNSSNPKITSESENEREEREVKDFAKEFIKSYEDSKNIREVPKSFFISDFNFRFSQTKEWVLEDGKVSSQITDSERFEFNALMLDMTYMTYMWYAGSKEICFDRGSDYNNCEKEDKDEDEIKKFFPTKLFEKIKENEKLYLLFSEKEGVEIINVIEMQNVISNLKEITKDQREHINNRQSQWRGIFEKNKSKIYKENQKYEVKKCDKNCEGLPIDAKIFEIVMPPLSLQIVKENFQYKIININLR